MDFYVLEIIWSREKECSLYCFHSPYKQWCQCWDEGCGDDNCHMILAL